MERSSPSKLTVNVFHSCKAKTQLNKEPKHFVRIPQASLFLLTTVAVSDFHPQPHGTQTIDVHSHNSYCSSPARHAAIAVSAFSPAATIDANNRRTITQSLLFVLWSVAMQAVNCRQRISIPHIVARCWSSFFPPALTALSSAIACFHISYTSPFQPSRATRVSFDQSTTKRPVLPLSFKDLSSHNQQDQHDVSRQHAYPRLFARRRARSHRRALRLRHHYVFHSAFRPGPYSIFLQEKQCVFSQQRLLERLGRILSYIMPLRHPQRLPRSPHVLSQMHKPWIQAGTHGDARHAGFYPSSSHS